MTSIHELPEQAFAQAILLLINRNSRGYILPSLRGITAGWTSDHQKVHLIAYFDRQPTENDSDSIQEIAAEIEASVGFSVSQNRFDIELDAEVRESTEPFARLESLGCWAFFRDEGETIHYTPPAEVIGVLQSGEINADGLLLAAQQALIGRITASTREVTLGWNSEDRSVQLRAYSDTQDNQRQKSLLDDAARDLTTFLRLSSITTEVVYSDASYGELDNLGVVAYLRYEPEMDYYEDEA